MALAARATASCGEPQLLVVSTGSLIVSGLPARPCRRSLRMALPPSTMRAYSPASGFAPSLCSCSSGGAPGTCGGRPPAAAASPPDRARSPARPCPPRCLARGVLAVGPGLFERLEQSSAGLSAQLRGRLHHHSCTPPGPPRLLDMTLHWDFARRSVGIAIPAVAASCVAAFAARGPSASTFNKNSRANSDLRAA